MSTPLTQTQSAALTAPVDDDDTIREVLQTITAGPPQLQSQAQTQLLAQAPMGMPTGGGLLGHGSGHGHGQYQEVQHFQAPPSQMPQVSAQLQSAYIPMLAEPPTRARQQLPAPQLSLVERYWDTDAQKALWVALLAAVAIAMPVEKVVFQYVNIAHVPYAGALVKAVCIAAAFYVVTKLQ